VFLNSNEHKRAVIEVETRDARFVRDVQARYPLHQYRRLAGSCTAARGEIRGELALIRQACELTARLPPAARIVKPGVHECEVEAELAHEFRPEPRPFAYPPIIASGRTPACCTTHQ